MSRIHTEIEFEDELVGHLLKYGSWLEGESSGYDSRLALYPEDVIGWIQDTQPGQYAKVKTTNNGNADRAILDRLADELNDTDTSRVLRRGFKRVGVKFSMCAFKPGNTLNPATLEKYSKVRCRVVRQLHYSENNANSIDVTLFINGIPVATLELKTDFTQTIDDAMAQYRRDRLPNDKGTGREEPLLKFKRGALVHFAVSTDEVRMTTRLTGESTYFLPFNLGKNDGAGNPDNSDGFKTSYLWERILQRDTFLEILEKFVHLETKKIEVGGKTVTSEQMLFPRYHQWDAVKKLISDTRTAGPGHNYLVQHSAGSGKSNTIKWLSHQLSSLHDDNDQKIYDTVIVITDRVVLDDQLKDAIMQFEHQDGVVVSIDSKNGSKTGALYKALEQRRAIIIVTIQTFPAAVEALSKLKDLNKRSFAVIADEAHSSQTGEAANDLRTALGIVDGDAPDGAEVTAEDALLAVAAKRAGAKNISYFAFTATPKPKTLMRFGIVRNGHTPEAFHTYTMQQAIEEEFILDVLQHYTTYEVAHKLATQDDKTGSRIVPKSEAARLVAKSARLHSYMIEQKVAIIVEHYRENVQALLGGRAKAMVVADGRKAAFRYKRAIDKYIGDHGYKIATLVAFSNKVTDDVDGVEVTVNENDLNHLKNEKIPDAFDTDRYQVLLVADKYQTGFDQPLLVAMYVDKKLSGVTAVQTLSRLNRTYVKGTVEKADTYVLDFVNTDADILEAFKPYYKHATLTDITDPNIIHKLESKLDKAGFYGDSDVEAYFKAFTKAQSVPRGEKRQSLLKAVLDPIVTKFRERLAKAKEQNDQTGIQSALIFRDDVSSFVRLYSFLAQIYNYADTDIEKRYLLYTGLARVLIDAHESVPVDVSGVEMTHFKAAVAFEGKINLEQGEDVALKPITAVGSAKPQEKKYSEFSKVIEALNEVLGLGIEDSDEIVAKPLAVAIVENMISSPTLKSQSLNNSLEQLKNASEVQDFTRETIVQTEQELVERNNLQSSGFEDAMIKLLGDKEGMANFVSSLIETVYKHHNQQAQ